jgi:hypothetical protein
LCALTEPPYEKAGVLFIISARKTSGVVDELKGAADYQRIFEFRKAPKVSSGAKQQFRRDV